LSAIVISIRLHAGDPEHFDCDRFRPH
jgi:hypothetical protein